MTKLIQQSPFITIGIIFGKNDLKYLPYTLKSVFTQTYTNFEVRMHNNVLDEKNTEADDQVWQWIQQNYPQVKLERSGNIGFGSAHNAMIRQMEGDYYLCYNPDIILEPDFLEQLVTFLNNTKKEHIGVVGGRLMYWDFAQRDTESQGKTDQIDSLGLQIKKTHRVVDIGQGEKVESLKFKVESEEVFGLSGAMFLASREALEAVAYKLQAVSKDIPSNSPYKGEDKKEYFDETIFLYKEDVDLAYRFRLAGYRTFVVNDAVAYHDRSIAGNFGLIGSRKSKQRMVKGQTINTWSFLHHHILLYKNWQAGFGWRVKLSTFFYEIASNLYLLIFEFKTFWNGWKLFRQKLPEIKKRRALTVKKVSAREIEKWME